MKRGASNRWLRAEMGKGLFFLCAVGIVLVTSSLAISAQPLENYCYRETRGSDIRYFSWILEGEDPLLLNAGDGVEQHFNVLDPQKASRVWHLTNEREKTDLSIRRNGRSLQLTGLFFGRHLERVVTIDDAPWYQALSVGLRNLLQSQTATLEFWMVRPDTLDVRRMRAVRRALEDIETEDGKRQARHIRITAVGIPSWVWRGDYWFDEDAEVFLRYQGRSGPPGAPLNLIELSSKPVAECSADFGTSLMDVVRDFESGEEKR
ncbi:hypothetical protein SAMN05660860_02731 [Geoalkalibacter ferrihydriticus]|nr:hypothetical protein SAMN05660860_02731 [Geoalkalibacter ferrihydriticus]